MLSRAVYRHLQVLRVGVRRGVRLLAERGEEPHDAKPHLRKYVLVLRKLLCRVLLVQIDAVERKIVAVEAVDQVREMLVHGGCARRKLVDPVDQLIRFLRQASQLVLRDLDRRVRRNLIFLWVVRARVLHDLVELIRPARHHIADPRNIGFKGEIPVLILVRTSNLRDLERQVIDPAHDLLDRLQRLPDRLHADLQGDRVISCLERDADLAAVAVDHRVHLIFLLIRKRVVLKRRVWKLPVYPHIHEDRKIRLIALAVVKGDVVAARLLRVEAVCNLLSALAERRRIDSVHHPVSRLVGIQIRIVLARCVDRRIISI